MYIVNNIYYIAVIIIYYYSLAIFVLYQAHNIDHTTSIHPFKINYI